MIKCVVMPRVSIMHSFNYNIRSSLSLSFFLALIQIMLAEKAECRMFVSLA